MQSIKAFFIGICLVFSTLGPVQACTLYGASGGWVEDALAADNVAWASAAYGAKARSNQMVHWSDALVRGVLDYCARVGPLVDRVGCVDAKAVHVYHGELKHRQYQARHRVLRETDFDPERHVEYAPNGTLRWSDAAPAALRNGVRNYLLNRGEDNEPSYT